MSINYIGAHILGNKSILENIKECKSINGNAIQIFLKSPIKSNVKINLTKTDISNINKYIKTNNMFFYWHAISWIRPSTTASGIVLQGKRHVNLWLIAMGHASNNIVASARYWTPLPPNKAKHYVDTMLRKQETPQNTNVDTMRK